MFIAAKKILSILDSKQKTFSFFLFLAMLFGAFIESLGVSLILPLVDVINNGDTWNTSWYGKLICNIFNISSQREFISFLLVALIFIFLFKNIYLFIERYMQFTFIANSRLQLQRKLMHKYIKKPYEYYLSSSTGEIVRIINGDAVQAFNVLTITLSFFTELLICIALSVTLIVLSPSMSIFFIVLLSCEAFIISKYIAPYMSKIGNLNRVFASESNKWMLGLINGIKSIKVSGTGEYFESMYYTNAVRSVDKQRKNQTLASGPKLFIEGTSVAAVLAYVLVLVKLNEPLENLVPLLSAFAIAAMRLMPSVSNITSNINDLSFQIGGLNNIISILEEKVTGTDSLQSSDSNTNISFKKSIEFRDITYYYPNTKQAVIENANFEIRVGESVGIMGKSGAGKTTTVDIILGLLQPRKGSVYVDGKDIFENIPSWISHLAYIPQSIFLMDDTIRANVAFGIDPEKVTDEQVWKALDEAQLADFVKDLPEQLETRIGERGVRLSGGQGQRLGIARALYNNPELLIFDEATSSLDNETEKAIMKSISHLKGRKTMIIIAHRLTTIEDCDSIYKVDNRKITKVR